MVADHKDRLSIPTKLVPYPIRESESSIYESFWIPFCNGMVVRVGFMDMFKEPKGMNSQVPSEAMTAEREDYF
jgi:hypothetical protein